MAGLMEELQLLLCLLLPCLNVLDLAYNLANFGHLLKIKFKKLSEPIPQNKGKHCFNFICIDTY